MILSYHAVPTEEEMFFIGSTLMGEFVPIITRPLVQCKRKLCPCGIFVDSTNTLPAYLKKLEQYEVLTMKSCRGRIYSYFFIKEENE